MEFFQNILNYFQTGFHDTFIAQSRYMLFIRGLGNTILIAIFATLIGVVLGILVAIVRVYSGQTGKLRWLDRICALYLTIIRGTPTLVQLLIAYFMVFAWIDNVILVCTIAFGINSGAYVAEIVRGGILSVDKGQTEAGRSLGLSASTTMRSIVLPQAFKSCLPSLGNEFITILKETSIAGYIGAMDLTKAADLVRSRTYDPFFSLITIALIYLVIVIGMNAAFKALERRLAKSDRR